MSTLSFSFSPSSRLPDIRAFLDSYAVELSIKKVLNIRMPVQYCASGLGVAGVDRDHNGAYVLAGYDDLLARGEERCGFSSDDLALALTRYIPPEIGSVYVSTRVHNHTWPFTVTHPLEIIFTFGEYWWIFKFRPEERYGERTL